MKKALAFILIASMLTSPLTLAMDNPNKQVEQKESDEDRFETIVGWFIFVYIYLVFAEDEF
jgi:hypothetical protein